MVVPGSCHPHAPGTLSGGAVGGNASCRADVADVLRSLRGRLTARQWSRRAVGELELHASAGTYHASPATKHESLESAGAIPRVVEEESRETSLKRV